MINQVLRRDVEFVSAHPMAGREVYGVENSDDKIFAGANYIAVPTKRNTKEGILNCKKLGIYLGFARIASLSPEEHCSTESKLNNKRSGNPKVSPLLIII